MFICVQGVCADLSAHACGDTWRPEVGQNLWICSSDAVSIMCFEMGSVTGLEFTK